MVYDWNGNRLRNSNEETSLILVISLAILLDSVTDSVFGCLLWEETVCLLRIGLVAFEHDASAWQPVRLGCTLTFVTVFPAFTNTVLRHNDMKFEVTDRQINVRWARVRVSCAQNLRYSPVSYKPPSSVIHTFLTLRRTSLKPSVAFPLIKQQPNECW